MQYCYHILVNKYVSTICFLRSWRCNESWRKSKSCFIQFLSVLQLGVWREAFHSWIKNPCKLGHGSQWRSQNITKRGMWYHHTKMYNTNVYLYIDILYHKSLWTDPDTHQTFCLLERYINVLISAMLHPVPRNWSEDVAQILNKSMFATRIPGRIFEEPWLSCCWWFASHFYEWS